MWYGIAWNNGQQRPRFGRLLSACAVTGLVAACASTTVETSGGVFQVVGTFTGIQDGTAAGIVFQNEQIVFLLVESGDSVVGTYDVTGISGGEFRARLNRMATGLFADLEMTQNTPCAGTYSGDFEAREGTAGGGRRVIALSGSYSGSDCGGAVDAAFFVQN